MKGNGGIGKVDVPIIRITLAQELLRGSRLDMETVAERVGFIGASAPARLEPPSRMRQSQSYSEVAMA